MRDKPDPRETRERYQRAKQAGQDMILSLLAELVPDGVKRGDKWDGGRARWRGDRHGGSLVISLRADKVGAWVDYATGDKGDLIHLVQIANQMTASDAVRWLEDRAGIRAMSAADRADFDRRAKAARDKAEREAAAKSIAAARDARGMWTKNGAPLDLADHYDHPVAAYFRGRSCPLEGVPNLAVESFRVVDRMDWWMWSRFRGQCARAFPALMSKFIGPDGGGRSVHVTFVDAAGRGKARVPEPRLAKLTARGVSTEGLMIEVAHGPGGVGIGQGGVPGPVIVTEGIEDAATLAIAAPDCRVIAAGSLWGVCSLPDLAEASAYVLARDNDWHAGEARDQFDRAVARLKGAGKPVEVIESPMGKDFNDLAKEMDDE